MRLLSLSAALLALPLLLGAAPVYRWVDESGVVNYTQLKPEGVEAELVTAGTGQRVTSTPPAPAQPAADTTGQPQLSESQQQLLSELQAAEQARQEEVARIKDANCQQARSVLDRLTVRGRIRIRGEDGQERMMPEEERQQRIDEAQRGIAANCTDTAGR